MKGQSLTWASISAAIVASLCCIGPIAGVVLGLGSFGAAAAFEHLRPYFLGLTALFLAGAFYLTYRPSRNEACAAESCPPSSSARNTRMMLWIATGSVALLALFPYYSPLVWKALARTPVTTTRAGDFHLSTAELRVEGMTCGGCAAAAQDALSRLKGVARATVSLDEETATVEYDPSMVGPQNMIQAIEGTGYKASLKR